MGWKCPKCKQTFSGKNAYNRMQKHYGSKHGKSKAKGKGYEKKNYVYRPPKKFGGK